MYMCFYPWPHCHLHTHRGDMIKQIIKQVRGTDISKLSFYSPQGCPWTHTQMQAESWLYTEPSCSTDISELFGGRKQTRPVLSKRWAVIFWKPLWQAAWRFTWKFHRDIFFFFELTFSENFVLQTSGNPCTLKQTPFWTGPRITLTLRSLHGINANFLH